MLNRSIRKGKERSIRKGKERSIRKGKEIQKTKIKPLFIMKIKSLMTPSFWLHVQHVQMTGKFHFKQIILRTHIKWNFLDNKKMRVSRFKNFHLIASTREGWLLSGFWNCSQIFFFQISNFFQKNSFIGLKKSSIDWCHWKKTFLLNNSHKIRIVLFKINLEPSTWPAVCQKSSNYWDISNIFKYRKNFILWLLSKNAFFNGTN